MMPLQNRNPARGAINQLYKAAEKPQQAPPSSKAQQHPFIQQLLQQQQQQQQQQPQQQQQQRQQFQQNSIGGIRRGNNGSVTQFKVPAPAELRPVGPASAAIDETAQKWKTEMRQDLSLLEEKLVLFESIVVNQSSEISKLRDELEISSIGTLKIRVIDTLDVYEERSQQSVSVETMNAGSIIKVSYPFEENDEGLWAAKQVVELSDKGLVLTGRYFLLAARNSDDSYLPKVSIIHN